MYMITTSYTWLPPIYLIPTSYTKITSSYTKIPSSYTKIPSSYTFSH